MKIIYILLGLLKRIYISLWKELKNDRTTKTKSESKRYGGQLDSDNKK